MEGFRCIKCGACCMGFNLLKESLDNQKSSNTRLSARFYLIDLMLENFPHKIDENGVCEKLVKNVDGTYNCSVYEDRPLMCNVDNMFFLYRSENKTIQDYYYQTEKACRILMHAIFNLDEEEIREKYKDL